MYSDERRSIAHVRSLRAAELLTDPDAVIARLEALEAQRTQDAERLAELEATLGEESARAASETSSRRAVQQELNVLTHSFRMAQGALTAYRAETARLKEDLVRVRGSRSMKVGRAVVKPATAVRKIFAPRAEQRESPQHEDAAVTERSIDSADAPGPTSQPAGVPGAPDHAQKVVSLEYLLEAFHADSDPVRLMRVVNHRWFTRGEIREPAALLSPDPPVGVGAGCVS